MNRISPSPLSRRRPRTVASLVLLIAALTVVPSVTAEDLDLETAIALALESNLGLESELLNVRQKRLIAETWWNRFYPQMSASATLARGNTERSASALVPTSEIAPGTGVYDRVALVSSTLPRWSVSTNLNFSLDLTVQLVPGIRLSRLDYEAGLITLDQARERVELDVARQFYDLLLLREQIALVAGQIDAAERRYQQAQRNFDAGFVDEFTALSAQVAWENQRPQLTGLEVRYQQLLLAFKNSIGLPFSTEVTPVGAIDPPDITFALDDLTDAAIDRRFDVQQLRAVERILIEQYNLTNAGRSPVVRLGLGFDPAFTGDPFGDNWFSADSWSQRGGAFSVTIVQPIDPWLPSSQLRNQLADNARQIQQNRIQQRQARAGAEIEIRSLISSIEAARETVAALERNIELSRRAYELAEVGYNNGLRDLLDVQNAEVELQSAEFQVLQQRKSILDNLLSLAFALNTTLDELTTRSDQ